MNDLLASFIIQSNELLDGSEESLSQVFELVQAGKEVDKEYFNSIFRTFHTIKGVAGFLNLEVVIKVAHKGEYVLDELRRSSLRLDQATIELLIKTSDFLRLLFSEIESTSSDDAMATESIVIVNELDNCLQQLKGDHIEKPIQAESRNDSSVFGFDQKPLVENEGKFIKAEAEINNVENDFEIEITQEVLDKFIQECNDLTDDSEQIVLQFEKGVVENEQIAQLYRNIHSFKGNCGFVGFTGMEEYSHRLESILDLLRESKILIDKELHKLFFECLDVLRNSLKNISEGNKELNLSEENSYKKIGQILEEFGTNSVSGVKNVVRDFNLEKKEEGPLIPSFDDDLEEGPKNKEVKIAIKDLNNQIKDAQANDASKKVEVQQAIRVDMQKLDYLQNMVGELLIAKEMVAHNPDILGLDLPELNRSIERLSRITNELQDISMSVRMVPISTIFSKMNRLARDLSRKSGKNIRMEIEGDDTEVDKLILDLISDPLVHIIRNAGDHGIEPSTVRLAAGKSKEGCIKLRAEQTSSDLVVEIHDDGKGLARDIILKKGIEKGLVVGDGSNLSNNEIFQLIFEPGFSTAEKVTDISGRGVGMDVVKKNIEKAKGRIEIYSNQGLGTTFIIRIPLTLATIEVMLVSVGDSIFSIPISRIQEAFKPSLSSVFQRPDGEYFVTVRENIYQIIRLDHIYHVESKSVAIGDGILLLVEVNNEKVCVLVDEILYQVQTVVKNLSSYMQSVKTISGCNILGTGEVSLIINLEELIKGLNKTKVAAV